MASFFPPELSTGSESNRLSPPTVDVRSEIARAGRYIGPGYSFGATPLSVFGYKGEVSTVVTSIINILTTPKGTVPHDPDMGSIVPLLVFDPLDVITMSLIRHYSKKDVEEQEPRVNVLRVLTDAPIEEPNAIYISLGFQIVGDPYSATYNVPVDIPRESI